MHFSMKQLALFVLLVLASASIPITFIEPEFRVEALASFKNDFRTLVASLSSVAPSGQVAGVTSLDVSGESFFKRSDVLLSPRGVESGWKAVYDSFLANRIAWTYAWNTYVPLGQKLNIPVQCTFTYWIPASEPLAPQMECPGAKGKTVGLLPDVRTKAWQTFQLANVKKQIDAGCTAFQQDGMGASEGLSYGCGTKEEIVSYNTWLHDETQKYAWSIDPSRRITFSTNITNNQFKKNDFAWILDSFDFLVNETYGDRATTLSSLRSSAAETRYYDPAVSASTLASEDVWLNQRFIASAYALGILPIAPWSVYTGPTMPRFYGNATDFAKLYSVVRNNQTLFDSYTFLRDSDNTSGVIAPLQPLHYSVTPGADGGVKSVDTVTYPDRVTIKWTGQSSYKKVVKGQKLRIGSTVFTTTGGSNVGNIYLPVGSQVAVNQPVFMKDLSIPPSPVLVSQGLVTKVDATTYPQRVAVTWTGRTDAENKNVPKGTTVTIAEKNYSTVVDTTVGNIYVPAGTPVAVGDTFSISKTKLHVVVTTSQVDKAKRAVHLVNWDDTTVRPGLSLSKYDFPKPPNKIVTSEASVATAITPELRGNYYVYTLPPLDTWLILFAE